MRTRVVILSLLTLCLWGQAPDESAVTTAEQFWAEYGEMAVAADHHLASAAGAEILSRGGNAADAAAATALALGVANPASSGMGGGGFLLYFKKSDRSIHFLDFRERAPAAANANMYDDVDPPMDGPANAASQLFGLASGVPGEPAGIAKMVDELGSLPLSTIVEPAVRLAERGIPVTSGLARMSAAFGGQMRRDPLMRTWFPGAEGGLNEGDTIRQAQLARTLRAFGRGGRDAIYRGRIARQIVQANRRMGGVMTAADLRDYEVVRRDPLDATHFGLHWVTAPPPSAGGFTMLQSLAILERIPARWRPTGGERPEVPFLHALAESWKGPYLDRQRYFGDPDHVELPLGAMMHPDRLQARANAFHPALANPAADYDLPLRPPDPVVQSDNAGTSHLCVVDREGNVASLTTTVNLPFGARYTAAGMVMNDEMDDFARGVGVVNAFGLVGGAPNLPAPGKRPVSTMSPTIVFDDEGPVLCLGAAGGSRIVTATQQVAMNQLLFQMEPHEALEAPRIHHQAVPNELRTEEVAPMDEARLAGLLARGHAHRPIHNVANVQLIRMRNGRLIAASDPRKGGRPAGR